MRDRSTGFLLSILSLFLAGSLESQDLHEDRRAVWQILRTYEEPVRTACLAKVTQDPSLAAVDVKSAPTFSYQKVCDRVLPDIEGYLDSLTQQKREAAATAGRLRRIMGCLEDLGSVEGRIGPASATPRSPIPPLREVFSKSTFREDLLRWIGLPDVEQEELFPQGAKLALIDEPFQFPRECEASRAILEQFGGLDASGLNFEISKTSPFYPILEKRDLIPRVEPCSGLNCTYHATASLDIIRQICPSCRVLPFTYQGYLNQGSVGSLGASNSVCHLGDVVLAAAIDHTIDIIAMPITLDDSNERAVCCGDVLDTVAKKLETLGARSPTARRRWEYRVPGRSFRYLSGQE